MSDAFNQMLAQGPTPIKFADPVNQMAQLMQLKNAQQTGVVNQMAIDKGQRQQADQATLRNMLGQTGFNVNDPAQRAQLLGYEGGPEIVTALDTSALNKSKLTETNNKAITSGILNSQNLLANVDPDAPDAVPRLKAIMSASFQNPELAGFLAMHGQTEQSALDSIDQAASSGKLKGWYTSAISNAESVRKNMELQETPQSNEGRIQADMARLPLDSPERAALQAVIDKRGRFAPDAAVKPPAINKMTIRDPKNPDRSIIVNANVPPSDPNYLLGEAPQSASALAAQTKKEAADEAKQAGKQTVDNIIASLEQNVADLEAAGGLADTDKSAIENIGPFARSTKIGQVFGAMTGSKVQSILEIMKSNRLQLLNAMKTASGMSSKVVDSNQELKTWLESFGKEGGSKQAVLQILKNLKSYGEGDTGPVDRQSQALEWAKSNPNDPRAAVILQKLGVQ